MVLATAYFGRADIGMHVASVRGPEGLYAGDLELIDHQAMLSKFERVMAISEDRILKTRSGHGGTQL